MSAHNINHYLTRCRIQLQCGVNNLSVSCKCLMLNHAAITRHLEVITAFVFIHGGMYLPHKYAVYDFFNTEYLILHFVKYSSICNVTLHAIKAYKGRVDTVTLILNLCTRWRWVVTLVPQPVCPQAKCPGTSWTGGYSNKHIENMPSKVVDLCYALTNRLCKGKR
jgi:hypothetical protein